MANQYDEFVRSNYIGVPFQNYLQAGKMEQDAYNQDRARLEDIQDKLAMIRKRQVDIPGVNAIVDEYSNKGLDLLTNNKVYSPDMTSEVRRLARQAIRDPRLEAVQYAYQQEQNEKELEAGLKKAGKTPYYRSKDWMNKPLLDEKGNLTWKDYQDIPLGTEAQHDYYSAAQEYTKGILPKLADKGISISDIGVTYKDASGKVQTIPRTVMTTGQRKTLDPKAQWVLGEVDKVLDPFIQSAEGNQYVDARGKAFDSNDTNQQERYKGFGEQGKSIYGQDAARNLLLSTIKPVDESINRYEDLTVSQAQLKALNGSSSAKTDPAGNPFYNAIKGNGFGSTPGQATQTVAPNTPTENIILTADEIKRAEQRADDSLKEYIKNINSPAYNSGAGLRQVGKLFGIDGELSAEDFKRQALEKEFNLIKEVKKERLLENKDSNAAYTPQTWTPTDKATVSALNDKKASINPAQAMISNATGNNQGVNLAYFFDKFFEGAQYSDVVDKVKYSNQATSKTPEGYSVTSSEYIMEVPEKVAEKARSTNPDIFNDKTVQKEGDKYIVKFKVPSGQLYDRDSEINAQRSEGVFNDKDPYVYQKAGQFADLVVQSTDKDNMDFVWEQAQSNKLKIPVGNKAYTVRANKQTGTVKVPYLTSKGELKYTDMQVDDFIMNYYDVLAGGE